MAFMWIEVLAQEDRIDGVRRAAEKAGVSEVVVGPADPGGRRLVKVLAGEIDRQALLDQLQSVLQGSGNWRIVVSDTQAVVPHTEAEDQREQAHQEERQNRSVLASREELFQSVARGAVLDRNFIVLVVLSTVVAGIGLTSDSVAVLIGAMVIAPLLGPNLALAFGIAVGDRQLITKALLTSGAGLSLAVVLAACIPLLVDVDLSRGELAARTVVGYDSVALALASGAAASLSITTGLSATLVGVMVAVALLPPAATLGISLSEGAFRAAAGAALLLAVNIVSVNLAANMVFLVQGIRPRTWWERQGASQSVRLTIIALMAALAALIGLIALGQARG